MWDNFEAITWKQVKGSSEYKNMSADFFGTSYSVDSINESYHWKDVTIREMSRQEREDLMADIESHEWISDDLYLFWEFLIEKSLQRLTQQINISEWIALSSDNIYRELLYIVSRIEGYWDSQNIYIKNIWVFKENFLSNKSDALAFIELWLSWIFANDYYIDEAKEWYERTVEVSDNLNTWYHLFRRGIASIFDLAYSNTEDELKLLVNDIKHLPFFETLTSISPEFEEILFYSIVEIIKVTPKEVFLSNLDQYFRNILTDLTAILDGSYEKFPQELKKEVKVTFIRSTARFVDGIINPSNTALLLPIIESTNIIKQNPLLWSLYTIATDENLYNKQEQKFSQEAFELIQTLNKSLIILLDSWIIYDDIGLELDHYVSELSQKISSVSHKISDPEKIIRAITYMRSYQWNNDIHWNMNDNNGLDIDYFEWMSAIYDNLWLLMKVTKESIFWDVDSLNSAIKRMVEEGVVEKNASYAWGKLIERMKHITGVNPRDLLFQIRNDFLQQLWDIHILPKQNNVFEKGRELWNFPKGLANTMQKKLFGLLQTKFESWENNHLKKEDITLCLVDTTRSFIWKNQELFIDFLKDSGVAIESSHEIYILEFTEKILMSWEFQKVIDNIASNSLTSIASNENSIQQLKSVFWDFVQGKWHEYMWPRTKEIASWLALNTFYEVFLLDRESMNEFLKVFHLNISIDFQITPQQQLQAIEVFKKYISPDIILQAVKKHRDITEIVNDSELMWEFVNDIYVLIYDKVWFLQDINNIGILESLSDPPSSKDPNTLEMLSLSEIHNGVNMLYITMEEDYKWEMWSWIADSFSRLWLNKVLENLSLFGNNGEDNIILFLRSIPQNDLIDFLWMNKKNLVELQKNTSVSDDIIAQLSRDLLILIDMDTIQKGTKQATNFERVLLDLSDEIQKNIDSQPRRFQYLLAGSLRLQKEFESWLQSGIDIHWYSSDLFDFLHELVLSIDDSYLWQNLIFENSDWEWNNRVLKKMKSELIWEFIENNFWFSIYSFRTFIGGWNWKGQILDDYFRNPDHKQNFIDTLVESYHDLKQ